MNSLHETEAKKIVKRKSLFFRSLFFLSLIFLSFSLSLSRARKRNESEMSFFDVSKLDALPSGTGLKASRFKPKVTRNKKTKKHVKRWGVGR